MWSVSAGSGVPVVMIHGAFSDYRYWEPQLESFSNSHHAIALSLRGYHPDDVAENRDFCADQHVEQVGEFLSSLLMPVHLVGHSRGGRIALHVAARYPAVVRSLVLAEPGGEMERGFLPPTPGPTKPVASAIDVRVRARALIDEGAIEQGLRIYVDAGHGEGAWERSPAIFRRVALSNAGTIAAMTGDRTAPLSRSVATLVKSPTLLIEGEKSPAIFGSVLDVLRGIIANTTRVVVPGADHFMTLNACDDFNKTASSFWKVCK